MKEYEVTVTEISSHKVTIVANSPEEASRDAEILLRKSNDDESLYFDFFDLISYDILVEDIENDVIEVLGDKE